MGVVGRRRRESDGEGLQPFDPPLIGSRLRPPHQLVRLVQRERLLRVLSSSVEPLVVVSAPGGFGKTIALSQWVGRDPRPTAWLQADESDDDPQLFLSYLISALRDVVELDARVPDWMQLAPPPVTTRIIPALAAAVAAAEAFLFVIDDIHLVGSQACWQIVLLLVEQLPPGAQICLAGRAEPPLPLARMRAEGRLLGLRTTDLALDPDEIGTLLALQDAPADAATITYLYRVTEGWAAGLYLAALASADLPRGEWLAGIQGHRRDIADYLASEVLDRTPGEVRRFLTQTSILERLSPGLCQAVTGNPNAADLLRTIAQNNLFLSALDDGAEWFRYHHLFADFLQAELRRGDEVELRGLHARAAEWFEAHDALEEAVRHWLAAGEPSRARDIVCRAHVDYASHALSDTIRRWLEMFTDEQILADPALTIVAGFAAPMTSDTGSRGRRWVTAALRLEPGDGSWPDANIPLRAMQAILVAALAPAGVTQMLASARLALELGEGADLSEHASAEVLLGQACWLTGDPSAAALHLEAGEDEGSVAQCLAQVAAIGIRALMLEDQSLWGPAQQTVRRGLARVEELGLPWRPEILPMLLAVVRLDAREADSNASGRLSVAEQIVRGELPSYMALLGHVVLGELLAGSGDLEGATQWVRTGLARLATYPDAGILGPRLMRLRDLLEERQLGGSLTGAERQTLELLASPLTLKEIAGRLHVSPETVHTHVTAVYRKLDVHVRSEAVEKARTLRLLNP